MKTAFGNSCRTPIADGPRPEETKPSGFRAGMRIAMFLIFGVAGFIAGRHSISSMGAVNDQMVPGKAEQTETMAATSDSPVTVVIVKTNFVSIESQPWDEGKWNELYSQPGTVARNAALAALLEKLAAVDPKRAMALAQAEGNLKFRDTLVQAALHGWAHTAPLEAGNWANALTDSTARDAAMSSVFAGAVAANPDEAMRVGTLLIQQNAGEASGYGTRLIDALSEAGKFAAAAQMAATGDAGVQRSIWMSEAYSKWAELQPAQAGQAASAIADPDAQSEALHGVVGGWAETDPAGLTQFLTQLPANSDRGQMIGQALENWAKVDPIATANWMNAHATDLGGDMDKGMQSIATVAGLQPDIAVAWAEAITDQNLRSEALNDVLRNWVQSDPPAAKNYFNTTQNLLPADRQQISEILAGLNPTPSP
jgi:hypothetical protein